MQEIFPSKRLCRHSQILPTKSKLCSPEIYGRLWHLFGNHLSHWTESRYDSQHMEETKKDRKFRVKKERRNKWNQMCIIEKLLYVRH